MSISESESSREHDAGSIFAKLSAQARQHLTTLSRHVAVDKTIFVGGDDFQQLLDLGLLEQVQTSRFYCLSEAGARLKRQVLAAAGYPGLPLDNSADSVGE